MSLIEAWQIAFIRSLQGSQAQAQEMFKVHDVGALRIEERAKGTAHGILMRLIGAAWGRKVNPGHRPGLIYAPATFSPLGVGRKSVNRTRREQLYLDARPDQRTSKVRCVGLNSCPRVGR
jgi:hypothetical protein